MDCAFSESLISIYHLILMVAAIVPALIVFSKTMNRIDGEREDNPVSEASSLWISVTAGLLTWGLILSIIQPAFCN